LLAIPDLLNQPNMSILKQLLQTLQPTENFDDVLSEFQPSLALCNVDYLYCGACKMLEDIMNSLSSFSYLLYFDVLITIQSIVNFVVVLLDKSGEPNGKTIHMGCSKAIIPFLRKRLGYSAHKLLSADFPSEDAGKRWQSKRYMALVDLEEGNERLFYKLLIDNIEEPLVRPAKRPAPDQLQKALRKTFSAEKKSKIRKAWDGTKVIYNVASWGATAVG
ncbi:hypothetical protein ACJX0J_038832, partial [Zea mays]